MPDTTKIDNKDKQATKAKKKQSKKKIPINQEKLQWLKGEGPQTD